MVRKGQDVILSVAVIMAMGLLITSPLPPVSYKVRANTLLVSFKDLIF